MFCTVFRSKVEKIDMFSFICLLFAFTCTTSCLANPIPKHVCVRDGKTYQVGENFRPAPCEQCFCSADGRDVCAYGGCFSTPCVDAVHEATQCCPYCPNGPTCKHSDGTIIKKGEVYKPNPYSSCMCPSSFHLGSTLAICAPTPVVHVTTLAPTPFWLVPTLAPTPVWLVPTLAPTPVAASHGS